MRQPTSIKPIRFQPQGFTLIEIVIGIVALGIALSLLSVLLFPQAKRSAEPFMQMRAAELGIALMNEMKSASFDPYNYVNANYRRCGEPDTPACIAIPATPNTNRGSYTSLNDFHGLTYLSNSLGEDFSSLYPNFSYHVDVCFSDAFGLCLPDTSFSAYKRVQVTITTPFKQEFVFSSIRGNY